MLIIDNFLTFPEKTPEEKKKNVALVPTDVGIFVDSFLLIFLFRIGIWANFSKLQLFCNLSHPLSKTLGSIFHIIETPKPIGFRAQTHPKSRLILSRDP